MPHALVVRRAHFNAAHRLHNPARSDEWYDVLTLGRDPSDSYLRGSGAVTGGECSQAFDQCARVGQRMTTGDALDHWRGQVLFEIKEMRAWDMSIQVAATAICRVFEGEAAVQDQQVFLSQALLKVAGSQLP